MNQQKYKQQNEQTKNCLLMEFKDSEEKPLSFWVIQLINKNLQSTY